MFIMTEERIETELPLRVYTDLPEKLYLKPELELIAVDFWNKNLTDFNHKSKFQLCLTINNSLTSIVGIAHFEKGKLKGIEQEKNSPYGQMGIRISHRLKDLEEGLRKKSIESYLFAKKGYVAGNDFYYERVRYNDNITENLKISTSLDFRNTNKFTGETTRINKDSEFSKEEDPSFLFRFLPDDFVGPHVIEIDRAWIKESILLLENELQAILHYRISPKTKKPKLEKELNDIKEKWSDSKRWEKKETALRELINIIIDLCEDKRLSKELGLHQSGGSVNQKRIDYIVSALPDPQPEKKSKAWHKKRSGKKRR